MLHPPHWTELTNIVPTPYLGQLFAKADDGLNDKYIVKVGQFSKDDRRRQTVLACACTHGGTGLPGRGWEDACIESQSQVTMASANPLRCKG